MAETMSGNDMGMNYFRFAIHFFCSKLFFGYQKILEEMKAIAPRKGIIFEIGKCINFNKYIPCKVAMPRCCQWRDFLESYVVTRESIENCRL